MTQRFPFPSGRSWPPDASEIVLRYPAAVKCAMPHHGNLISALGWGDDYCWLEYRGVQEDLALALTCAIYALADLDAVRLRSGDDDLQLAPCPGASASPRPKWGYVENAILHSVERAGACALISALPSDLTPSEWRAGVWYSRWINQQEQTDGFRDLSRGLALARLLSEVFGEIFREYEKPPYESSLEESVVAIDRAVFRFVCGKPSTSVTAGR